MLLQPGLIVKSFLVVMIIVSSSRASEFRGVSPVTDRILMLEFVDGRAFYETVGGDGRDGRVEAWPLDLERAARRQSYSITSGDDPAFREPKPPQQVGRKSKSHDFVYNGWAVEHVPHHAIYLVLPEPMEAGRRYRVATDGLVSRGASALELTFDPISARSETVHVSHIGYVPDSPRKIAYLSHWMGDLGGLELDAYAQVRFRVIDIRTQEAVFEGRPVLRQRHTEPDGAQPDESPHNNYTGADIWEMDFTSLDRPGEYVVAVERIGCSFPFRIGPDVYDEPFITAMRGLYHQRCGIERRAEHTPHVRGACHMPEDRLIRQSAHRHIDQRFSDGPGEHPFELTGEVRRDVWGGWHDAADYDQEEWHPSVVDRLLLLYELTGEHLSDNQLNIPESGNGMPDLLDEARWKVDFYRRLQRADGGVSVGRFANRWPYPGQTPMTDTLEYFVYAEDPGASFRYAATASRLAWCLELAGHANLAAPYVESAVRAWDWAGANMQEGDEARVRDMRHHAAAALFRVTGEKRFEDSFRSDNLIDTPRTSLSIWNQHSQEWGVWAYIMTDRPEMDLALKQQLTEAAIHFAREEYVEPGDRRGFRAPYNWWIPAWWGFAAVPKTHALAVAHHLTGEALFLSAIQSKADLSLGNNPLNMSWMTGLGHRSPRQIMHPETWHDNGIEKPIAGIGIFGPHRYSEAAAGPWEPGYAQQFTHPHARQWPPYELYFETRKCPPTNEFTVGTIADHAFTYGYLRAQHRR